MTHTMAGLLLFAAFSWVVVFCAMRIGTMSVRRCHGGCGRVVEPYTGVHDASRHAYCSTSCASIFVPAPRARI